MLCTASKADALPERMPVSVNGVEIPHDTIARETQNHPAYKPIAAWQSAARALVIRELLLQEARRLGIEPVARNDEYGRRETQEEALIRGLIEQEVAMPEPDEATCRRYYEQNRQHFRSEPIYQAAHILFPALRWQPAQYVQAKRAAAAVLGVLKRDPERFAELAQIHSACPSAAQGGNLGQVSAGQTTKEFELALAELAPGLITKSPVETPYGLHIIRLDRKIEGRDLSFDVVAGRIADYLRDSVERRATAQYVARLVSKAQISGLALAGAPEHQVS